MTKISISSSALKRSAEVSRILGSFGDGLGPTVVVTAGLHGNEPAGVFALLDVLDKLNRERPPFKGRLIALAGNLTALAASVRYVDHDLNRMWRPGVLDGCPPSNNGNRHFVLAEQRELRDLHNAINQIRENESGPFFFIDLHTTSSRSPPFIPFDDTLINREFADRFPVPGVLGIEEHLPGTLLSYLSNQHIVAIGYEGGQHDDPRSIEFHRALVWLALGHAGCLHQMSDSEYVEHESLLRSGAAGLAGFYEVRFRYAIQPGEMFRMRPGFKSFQPVRKTQELADNERGTIASPQAGLIFMPLYQAQGADGFFVVRRVARFWLELSKWLRQLRFERVLAWLPGVQLASDEAATLVVDTRVARFLATEIFHLLGYRRHVQEGSSIRFSRREI